MIPATVARYFVADGFGFANTDDAPARDLYFHAADCDITIRDRLCPGDRIVIAQIVRDPQRPGRVRARGVQLALDADPTFTERTFHPGAPGEAWRPQSSRRTST